MIKYTRTSTHHMHHKIERKLEKILKQRQKLSYFKKDSDYQLLRNIVRNRKLILAIIDLNQFHHKNKYTCMIDIQNTIFSLNSSDELKIDNRALIVPKKYLRMNRLINMQPQTVLNDSSQKNFLNKFQQNLIKSSNLIPTKIPFLYEIPFHVNLKLSAERQYILQNLPTTLPPLILNPPKNSRVIDTCASPGNKTTHLSEIMRNTGKIFAIEKDKNRFETLKENLKACGVMNTECINSDFCETDIEAEYILVDPSCSGSGIHNSYVRDEKRLASLSTFQYQILKKALNTKQAKKVVYSTCSVEIEENEAVVEKILHEFQDDWGIEKIESDYGKRGSSKYEFHDKVLKFDRGETIGFFCALFVRIS